MLRASVRMVAAKYELEECASMRECACKSVRMGYDVCASVRIGYDRLGTS
jgi:hypothetical protein